MPTIYAVFEVGAESYGEQVQFELYDPETNQIFDGSSYTVSKIVFETDQNLDDLTYNSNPSNVGWVDDGGDGLVYFIPASGDLDTKDVDWTGRVYLTGSGLQRTSLLVKMKVR